MHRANIRTTSKAGFGRRTYSKRRPNYDRQLTIVPKTGTREIKSFDTQIGANATLPTYGTPPTYSDPSVAFTGITQINDVQIGNTYFQRIGSKIVIKSVQLTTTVVASAQTVLGSVRLMLVYDRQPNGSAIAISDLLKNNNTNVTLDSGINMANRSRFLILRDKYVNIDGAQSLFHTVKWYVKGRWETEFGSSVGTIADINTGCLYFVCFTGVLTGIGTIGIQDPLSRIRYYD